MSLALLAERFPALAAALAEAGPAPEIEWRAGPSPALACDGIQLESRHDPRAEAALQARLVPADAPAATLYGTAQGSLVRALLARPALRRLRVVVLNPRLLREVLARVPCADWLGDERLVLELPDADEELSFPFAAPPAELRLARGPAARLADLVRLELATPFLRRGLRAREPEMLARIQANLARFGHDERAQGLFGTRPGSSLCVAAAGPSLARHYDELRARAHELVAVDAALKPLLAADVVPAFVVTQDPHEEGMRRVFAVEHAGLARSTLVWFPEVVPAVMERWPGPRRLAWSQGALHARFPALPAAGALFASGSVVHPAVDLAVRLGARRVELFGADFALCGGRTHVAGAAWERAAPAESETTVLDPAGVRVPSLPNLVGYLRDLERYLARHPEVEFVQRSREGAAIRGARGPEASHAA